MSIIGDRALKVYNDFSFSNGTNKNDIAVVLKSFEDHFMSEKNVTYKRHTFFLRHQRDGERIDTYLRDLSSSCDSDLYLIKDLVVLGIKGTAIKDRLLRIKDLDLSKSVEVCRASKQTRVQLAEICNSRPGSKEEDSILEVHKIKYKPKTGQNQQTYDRRQKPGGYGTVVRQLPTTRYRVS